jgi:hypothetical protein
MFKVGTCCPSAIGDVVQTPNSDVLCLILSHLHASGKRANNVLRRLQDLSWSTQKSRINKTNVLSTGYPNRTGDLSKTISFLSVNLECLVHLSVIIILPSLSLKMVCDSCFFKRKQKKPSFLHMLLICSWHVRMNWNMYQDL